MEKKIKKFQKKIERKRMCFEKRCMYWLRRSMNDAQDLVDGLSCEQYTSSAGQRLEQIAGNLECAESHATDMIACMLKAETAK